jgi:hypothetical protein
LVCVFQPKPKIIFCSIFSSEKNENRKNVMNIYSTDWRVGIRYLLCNSNLWYFIPFWIQGEGRRKGKKRRKGEGQQEKPTFVPAISI